MQQVTFRNQGRLQFPKQCNDGEGGGGGGKRDQQEMRLILTGLTLIVEQVPPTLSVSAEALVLRQAAMTHPKQRPPEQSCCVIEER